MNLNGLINAARREQYNIAKQLYKECQDNPHLASYYGIHSMKDAMKRAGRTGLVERRRTSDGTYCTDAYLSFEHTTVHSNYGSYNAVVIQTNYCDD